MFGLRSLVSAIAGAAIAGAVLVLFYEGLPLGPLRLIPILGPALEIVTDGRVDRERKAALDGYVQKVELTAADAKAAEADRRRLAAEHALAAYTRRAAEELAVQASAMEQLEQEIIQNEKLLAAQGRACLLDDADVEFLRNAGAKARGRR